MEEKNLTVEEACSIIESVANRCGDEYRDDYSGRCMYGKTCPGITTDDPMGTIEDCAAEGVRGARTDSMGRSTIVYWPRYDTTKKKEEVA